MELYERHRPKNWAEFVGNDKAISRLRAVLDRAGFDGGAFWIVGSSGIGKTTAAWLIARQFARDDIDITELDGEQCDKHAVRAATDLWHYSAMSGGFRVWIVNEAQGMSAGAIQAWLTALERRPARVIVVFTTTSDSEDLFGEFDGPFRSRCKTVALTNQGLSEAFARRAREIAVAENLDGKPEASYLRLAKDCKNNLRMMLQRIDGGELAD